MNRIKMSKSPHESVEKPLIFSQIRVHRARGWRLYTEEKKRLVDLWQDGGAAVLGHKPSLLVRELKNTAERGLFAGFASSHENKLHKALAALFPQKIFRIYKDDYSLNKALHLGGFTAADMAVWRPFSDKSRAAFLEDAFFMPVLPFPLAPKILVTGENKAQTFSAPDIISPLILACTTRAVYDLLANARRGSVNYPHIQKALESGGDWRQDGIYLYHAKKLTGEQWLAVWNNFLREGFLLPAAQADPLILPGELSPGEEKKLAQLLSARH